MCVHMWNLSLVQPCWLWIIKDTDSLLSLRGQTTDHKLGRPVSSISFRSCFSVEMTQQGHNLLRFSVKYVTTGWITIEGWFLKAGRFVFSHLSVFSTDEPSRSTTRNIWSTPAPPRTSIWSKKSYHDDHLLAPPLVYVHQVWHPRALSVGSSLHCKILFCVPLKLGS